MKKTSRPETVQVKKREEVFAGKATTKITRELPDSENPYVAQQVLWHGYDVMELARNRSLVDVVFLLIKGELPLGSQAQQLEHLLVLLANPGPRQAASRAVTNASVSRAAADHWLPIGLSLHGGEQLGAAAVRNGIRFLRKNMRLQPEEAAAKARESMAPVAEGDNYPAPGFGSCFGGLDRFAMGCAAQMADRFPENAALAWGMDFSRSLDDLPAGWLLPGVAAAVFVDLGLTPDAGAGLFQLAAAPGLLAQAIEMSGKPITAMPFVADENYHYDEVEHDA